MLKKLSLFRKSLLCFQVFSKQKKESLISDEEIFIKWKSMYSQRCSKTLSKKDFKILFGLFFDLLVQLPCKETNEVIYYPNNTEKIVIVNESNAFISPDQMKLKIIMMKDVSDSNINNETNEKQTKNNKQSLSSANYEPIDTFI